MTDAGAQEPGSTAAIADEIEGSGAGTATAFDRETAGVHHHHDMRRIARNGVLLGSLAMVSQFTGILRESTISYFLGATKLADTYIAAFQPIDVLTSALLLSVPFGVIPFLLALRKEYGPEAADWAAARMQLVAAPIVALLCLFLFWQSRTVMLLSDPALTGTQLDLSIHLWHWMLPSVVLASITAFFLAELIAEHKFLCQGLNQLLLNLSIVAVAILGWRFLGVFSLAMGVLLGFSAQLTLQAWSVLKGRRWLLASPATRPAVFRKALSMIGPVILLYFLGGLVQPIPRRFAAQFGNGSLASFTYAMRTWMPIFLVGVLSISYPYFSSFAAAIHDDRDQARRLLRSMIRTSVLFSLPAMAAVAVLRYDIVRVLFFRGAFNADAAASVSSTIAFLAPFLAAALIVDLLGRCLVALHRPLLACGIYGLMLALIWVVSAEMQQFGVNAIALGWSACFYVGVVGFCFAVTHFLPGVLAEMGAPLAKIVFASAISGLVMVACAHFLGILLGSSVLWSLARIVITLAAGIGVALCMSYWLRITEVMVIMRRWEQAS